jgi:hypothetical protein
MNDGLAPEALDVETRSLGPERAGTDGNRGDSIDIRTQRRQLQPAGRRRHPGRGHRHAATAQRAHQQSASHAGQDPSAFVGMSDVTHVALGVWARLCRETQTLTTDSGTVKKSVRTEGLGGPEQMKVVRAKKDGTPAITDGPFPESKEVLAGYWIIDVESPQRAYEIAARASAAPGPGGAPLYMPIEVRPVMMSSTTGDV